MDISERDPVIIDRTPEEPLHKQRETKDDGRYIIFYSFGDEQEAGETEGEAVTP